MTRWLARMPGSKRITLIYRLLNAAIIAMLIAFALRGLW